MTSLYTLHLSGNDISGTLPQDITIGPLLQDLSLSHNQLSEKLPTSMQDRSWVNLDLSFNRFTGLLSQHFAAAADNASVFLDVNRLSGGIPSALRDVRNISILNGNLFDCDTDRASLPRHDPDRTEYICGSETTNRSFYVFTCLFAVTVTLELLVLWFHRAFRREAQGHVLHYPARLLWLVSVMRRMCRWLDIFNDPATKSYYYHIYHLLRHMQLLRRSGALLTLFCISVLLPSYVVLSYYASMYQHEYIWRASAAFMKGNAAGYLLFSLLFITNIMLLHNFLVYTGITSKKPDSLPAVDHYRETVIANSPKRSLWQRICESPKHPYFWLAVIVTINITILVPVNVLYVYLTLYYNVYVIRSAQILLALFKLFWNDSILSYMLRRANEYLHYSYDTTSAAADLQTLQGKIISTATGVTFQILLILVNNIVIPCVTIAMISVNCYYNIMVLPARGAVQLPV